ncbi:PTS transporter subunit EIIC [Mycoplasma sp. ATU-Cv-508]|uniref:PTS transporter subunit EIIC n=1 Tax=Mycoplasma sp. ATU-Cv-508 TaxID=2048001 RepID=UPI001EFF9400
MNYIVGGKWTPTRGYFDWQEGVRSISFGALGGILTGFLGAIIYNKFHTFNRLPKVLSFFNGVRFVPLMVFAIVVPLACGLALFWPLLQAGINWMGTNIAKNNRVPFVMPFLFGTLERLMLPFGLHHLLTIPMNYTELGGNLNFLDADTFKQALSGHESAQGLTAEQLAAFFKYLVEQDFAKENQLKAQGQENMWYTWIQALNGVRDHWQSYASGQGISTSTEAVYQVVSGAFTPARFKTGQMISSTGSLVGAAFGMLYALKKSARPANRSIYVSGALACMLTGVTEPVEFLFMFVSPPLYLVHALLTGVAFGMADFLPMRIHAFGLIETLLKYLLVLGPTSLATSALNTNLWLDGVWFLFTTLIFAGLYALTFRTLVLWLKPPIPGWEMLVPAAGDTRVVTSRPPPLVLNDAQTRIALIVKLLGGKDNIQEVDACMTRLRIVVSDTKRVQNKFKELTQALATVSQGNYYQIVYGPEANALKEQVIKHLGNLSEESNGS